MNKPALSPEAKKAVLDLAHALADPDIVDQITFHEVESPFAEEAGSSMVVITCTGAFRELIECRKALLRDVVATLRLAHRDNI